MKIIYTLFYTLFISVFILNATYAQSPTKKVYKIYGKRIPILLENKNEGPFVHFIKAVAQKTKLTFDFEILPPKRANAIFDLGNGDMLLPYPMSETAPKKHKNIFKSPLLFSTPITRLSRHVLTLKTRKKVKNVNDLIGLKIGLAAGYSYSPRITHTTGAYFLTFNDQMALVKRLYSQDIDAILSFPFETHLITRKLNITNIKTHFDASFITSYAHITALFHDTESGRYLQKQVNKAIYKLQKEGRLQQILAPLMQHMM